MIFIRKESKNRIYMSADLVRTMPNFTVGVYRVKGIRHIALVETTEDDEEKIKITKLKGRHGHGAYLSWQGLAEMLPNGKRVKGVYYKNDKAVVFKTGKVY